MSTPFPLLALISGPEEVLAERAVDAIFGELRDFERDAETVRLAASSYAPGDLLTHASPSLFGGWTGIVISGLEEASDPLLEDVLTYLDQQPDSVVLILRHKGGNRGKRVVDAVKKAGARWLRPRPSKPKVTRLLSSPASSRQPGARFLAMPPWRWSMRSGGTFVSWRQPVRS
nr:hypothetical protein [Ornithinimicrobium sp. INDO-MA30-4]